MPATAARPELFVYLATQPMRQGKRGWPVWGHDTGSRAKESLMQALRDVLGQQPLGGPREPEAPVLYAEALASALVGAISGGRWSLKAQDGNGTIVGKF